MAKTPRATKETTRTTINQNREASHGVTSRNPFPPLNAKIETPQQIRENLPVDMVVGVFQVQLADNTWKSQFQPAIQTLISY